MALITILLFVSVVIFFLYKRAKLSKERLKERGVHFDQSWAMTQDGLNILFNRDSFTRTFLEFCRRNKAHKVVGYSTFPNTIFVINDPDLVKKIAIKDFEYFSNHLPFFKTGHDPILDSMLTIMKDQRWKDMRNTLTPVFTASKMRAMFVLMNECFDESLKNFHLKTKVGNGFDVELKECFTRLSNDIIASTAFGLKVNSYVDKNNEFYSIGQSITNFRGASYKFMLASIAPWLVKVLNIDLIDQKKTGYFKRLVVDAIKHRETNKIVRPDMIQLLMEAKKESTRNWSDDELVAQCFIFFFAAFENNANLICSTCHALMENPVVQHRLYEEAVAIRGELEGAPLSYDVVGKMKYMDMVVSESLRNFTLALLADRVCSKDYDLADDDGNLICKFKAGDVIWFPIIGFHNDEEYFANPDIFDPERFSEENKGNIKPFTYLPFGAGPRVCIGNRYALMQAKAMLYHLILDFKLERSVKTVPNIMDDLRGIQMSPVNGFWLRLVPRK